MQPVGLTIEVAATSPAVFNFDPQDPNLRIECGAVWDLSTELAERCTTGNNFTFRPNRWPVLKQSDRGVVARIAVPTGSTQEILGTARIDAQLAVQYGCSAPREAHVVCQTRPASPDEQ